MICSDALAKEVLGNKILVPEFTNGFRKMLADLIFAFLTTTNCPSKTKSKKKFKNLELHSAEENDRFSLRLTPNFWGDFEDVPN